jgi:hypothetical protein
MNGIVLLLATLCPAAAAPPRYDARIYHRAFMVPIQVIDPRVHRLEPYVSADSGRTWERLAVLPAAGGIWEVEFQLPRDGLYWLDVQFIHRDGSKHPDDLRDLVPCKRFWVDTNSPPCGVIPAASGPVAPPGASLPTVAAVAPTVAPAAPKESAKAARLTLAQAITRAERLGLGAVVKGEALDGSDVFRLELADGTVVKIDRSVPNRPAGTPAAKLAEAHKDFSLGRYGIAQELFEAVTASADPHDQVDGLGGLAMIHAQHGRFDDLEKTLDRLQAVIPKLPAGPRQSWEKWAEATKASVAAQKAWRFPPQGEMKPYFPVAEEKK